MPRPIQTLESKSHSNRKLERNLRRKGPLGQRSGDGGAAHVQPEHWCCEVGDGEEVKRSAEGDTGYTVQAGENPADLRAVDCEMGCDGTGKTLGDEDFHAGLVGLGGCFWVADGGGAG